MLSLELAVVTAGKMKTGNDYGNHSPLDSSRWIVERIGLSDRSCSL